MKNFLSLIAYSILPAFVAVPSPVRADAVSVHNLVWTTPSTDATGSMPLSGGILGLNVWVEGDDLLFYIGHPDSRMEDQKLVKLGRVRMSFSSLPFRSNFRQELDLAESCIRITGEGMTLKLWVDAYDPVVHVEMTSTAAVTASVAFESWRFTASQIPSGMEWFYRHDPAKSDRMAKINAQGLSTVAGMIADPLKNMTFGGRIVAPGLVADGSGSGTYMRTAFTSCKSKTASPVTSLDLRVFVRVAQDATVDDWRTRLDQLQTVAANQDRTLAWWRDFWNRSWIRINPDATAADQGWQVSRNYQLFRYMLAANRLGKTPTLFNGGFFTFDNPLANATAYDAAGPWPDERAWWGCLFMAQNQRHVYWPMLKAGDMDLLDVGLDFYRNRASLQEARSRLLMGVSGTPFNESLDVYGLIGTGASADGHSSHAHLRYHYTSALEFAYMMLEQCRFTERPPARSLSTMLGVLKFYDSFYQNQHRQRAGQALDANGRLVIYPGNAVEMGVGCTNHTDAIAGLQAITEGLLGLRISAADRAWLQAFSQRIPPITLSNVGGRQIFALAQSWESIANPHEFPQMYPCFPFHRYGVGLPGLDVAKNTWNTGTTLQKEAECWKYGNILAADLGLAHEAQRYAISKFLWPVAADSLTPGNYTSVKPRFPAFWSTYIFDAFPDMDHGGSAMVGLQEMLLQTPGNRILLLPAWPNDWDVDFKLHAPKNTTVECSVRNGAITHLVVTPASRMADVETFATQPPPPVPVSQGKPVTASSTWASAGYDATKAVDGMLDTRWSGALGVTTGWLEIDLGAVKTVTRAMVDESSYAWTKNFQIQAKVDGVWQTIGSGTTLGSERDIPLTSTAAQIFRLNITEATNVPTINEFQLFE